MYSSQQNSANSLLNLANSLTKFKSIEMIGIQDIIVN